MYGLINRAIQCFLRDTYGPAVWVAIAREAGLGVESFEPMLPYEPSSTTALIDAASAMLIRPRDSVFEDLGIYLASHNNIPALRRLLRFGGVTYVDFLHSLEELPGRARMALPELRLPQIEVIDLSSSDFSLVVQAPIPGTADVLVGILRAMADDYGVLCLVEHRGYTRPGDHCPDQSLEGEFIAITLAETDFSEGRRFELALDASERAAPP